MTTTARPFSRLSPLQLQAVSEVFRTADAMRRTFGSLLEPHGLTMQQYNVLRILRGGGGAALPTMEIAARMLEQTPGITRLLDRLEAKGLVSRERCEDDRRQVLCSITPAGRKVLGELDAAVDGTDEALLGDLGDAELRALVDALRRIRHQID